VFWIAGVVLGFRLLRKRDAHPRRDESDVLHCSRCDYVVDPALADRPCPECGTDLSDPRGVVSGNAKWVMWNRVALWLFPSFAIVSTLWWGYIVFFV